MQLSLSGFLFEDNYNSQSLDFADFATLAHSDGYAGLELRKTQVNLETPADVVKKYRSIADDNGLCITCMTPRGMPESATERDEFFDRYLDLAERMGCKMLKMTGQPAWFGAAAQQAANRGIFLAINTHTNSPTETVAGTKSLLDEVNHPNFGLLYDPMHLCIAGEDYLGAIDKFYPHIRNILVQCLKPADEGQKPAISFGGKDYVKTRIDDNPVQDWSTIFERFKSLGYDGWVTLIENSWPADQRKDIASRTAQHIRRLWEQA